MWRRLKVAVVKEIVSYWRDPSTRRLLIGAPILQTVVFAFAGTLDVRNIDVAILDRDGGRWAYEMTARIDRAGFTGDVIRVHGYGELSELISRRRVQLGVSFPPRFSRAVVSGEEASVQVIVDGRRANAGQIAVNYLDEIVGRLNRELAGDASGRMPEVHVRHWYNENLNYRWFMVVSLAAVLPMMLAQVITALSIARERELGTFDQLLVAPVNSIEIILAKTVPGMIGGTVVCALISLIAVFVFGAPFAGDLLLFAFCTVTFILSCVGFGLMVSSICRTQQQALLGTFFTSIPLVLTSGFFTPVENMPEWLQAAAQVNPVKHYIDIVRGCFFKGQNLAELWGFIWPLIVISAVTLAAATVIVRRNIR